MRPNKGSRDVCILSAITCFICNPCDIWLASATPCYDPIAVFRQSLKVRTAKFTLNVVRKKTPRHVVHLGDAGHGLAMDYYAMRRFII